MGERETAPRFGSEGARFVRRMKGRVMQTGRIEGKIKALYPLPPISV
jgi:hypothetical protein